ncbi:hypothetical protein I6B53_06700 [Schaalia sp. 19OD2882]|uniref:hypothetical protein n=1 Tax=Schaalia sp. 19OD2882 TaxID=2794089 RepID=UPI001C1EF4B6|nr:hypothetical protein [Schaalia sp. 19OD2882]QWW18841.1 hypothetical protein I6B53_06700 [Schaalia sp. 19OD2882]
MDPELKACTEAIDSEASVWRTGAAACSGVGTAGNALRLTGLKAGIFFPVVSQYNEVCDFVSAQGARANTLMTAAADALNRNATAYRNRDADTAASIEGAY